jgi:tetratricopeptide (TPR) repeat protein
MIDITAAREKLIEQERLRPGPGRSSALWEHGQPWQQAFDELVAAERAQDTHFEQLINTAPSNETRSHYLRQWSTSIREREEWYDRCAQQLLDRQEQWGTDNKGEPLAPSDLIAHRAMVDTYEASVAARRPLLELEYLEYKRHDAGKTDEILWRSTWNELKEAFGNQRDGYRNWYRDELPDSIQSERLQWCGRLQRLQGETAKYWGDARDVDWRGLQADSATVNQAIEALRPAPIKNGKSVGGALAAIAAVALIAFLATRGGDSNASPPATSAPRQSNDAVGQPLQATIASFGGNQDALNVHGKELIKDGHWEEAIPFFQAAFDAGPRTNLAYETLDNMAFCLYELDRIAEATEKWQQALALNPASPDTNAGLGMALYVSGRQDEGIEKYQKARDIEHEYGNENWLRNEAFWSERAIADSRPLRAATH